MVKKKIYYSALLLITSFALFTYFTLKHPEKSGNIILLNGASSAGKTSIMKSLRNLLGDSYVYIIGDDFAESYTKKLPEAMPRSLQNRQVLGDLFATAKKITQSRKNVFLDVVEFDDYYDYYCSILDCKTTIKILVYCPLDVIIQRVAQRNAYSEEKEHRPLNLSFGQFKGIYKLRNSDHETVVDHLKTDRLKKALKSAEQEVRTLMKEAYVKEEDIEKNLELFSKPFIEQFKIDSVDEITLTTQHKWDLIVNSGVQSPDETAQTIADFLKNKI